MGFDRLPAEVELTNPRHPLAGRRVPVMSVYRRNGGVWLMVMLPDGFPAPVRVGETELGGRDGDDDLVGGGYPAAA